MNKVIEINNLTKTYGKARGITDISFSVNEGDIFNLLGSLEFKNGVNQREGDVFMLLVSKDGFEHSIIGTVQVQYLHA